MYWVSKCSRKHLMYKWPHSSIFCLKSIAYWPSSNLKPLKYGINPSSKFHDLIQPLMSWPFLPKFCSMFTTSTYDLCGFSCSIGFGASNFRAWAPRKEGLFGTLIHFPNKSLSLKMTMFTPMGNCKWHNFLHLLDNELLWVGSWITRAFQ